MQRANAINAEDDSYSFVECCVIFEDKACSIPLAEDIPILPAFFSHILRERENGCDKTSKQLASGERLCLILAAWRKTMNVEHLSLFAAQVSL